MTDRKQAGDKPLRAPDSESRSPRAIVVGIQGKEALESARESLLELRELARTLDIEVVGEMLQRRESVHPAHFLGKGKLEELKDLAATEEVRLVLFDAELNPRQVRNLEKLLSIGIKDRSEVILDIFALRARTSQAKLQVELAQAEYLLPRLRNMWTHFSRTEGRVGMRAGSGEKQLEEDLRATRRKIHVLKKSLKEIEERKRREVRGRSDVLTVSLVGYTNAGKSTLMNRLTEAGTLAENKLFATLDTKTRAWSLPGGRRVLLSDTVGFVRRLPHDLVASFHATLEETAQADLLLHVVDASHSRAFEHVQAVMTVLEQIGAHEIPMITVLNKVDRLRSPLDRKALAVDFDDALSVSATTGEGMDELVERVCAWIDDQREEFEIVVPMSEGKVLSLLSRHGTVVSREEEGEDAYRLLVRMTWADAGKIQKECNGSGVAFHRVAVS